MLHSAYVGVDPTGEWEKPMNDFLLREGRNVLEIVTLGGDTSELEVGPIRIGNDEFMVRHRQIL